MRKSTIAPLLLVAALACLTLSCQKIQGPTQFEAELGLSSAEFTDAIPIDYGQLVSVTELPDYNAVLWFRRADESIVAVRVNYSRGALGKNVLEIPRR